MTSSDDDRLIEEIRAAKPAFLPSGEEWAKSERAERVLKHVLDASADTPGSTGRADPRPTTRIGTPRRLGIAFAGLLVVLAVSLGVVFAWPGEEPIPVALEPTTTPAASTAPIPPTTVVDSTVPVPVGGVSLLSAVENLMPVVESVMAASHANTTDLAGRLELAIALGLVTRDEVAAGAEAIPLTQGAYAVLLWKALADYLPADVASAGVVVGNATPEERIAIEALGRAGVLGPPGLAYVVELPLTPDTESRLLGRIERAIRGLSDS